MVDNSRRFLANGRGSFDKIISNIEKILSQTDHRVVIRINVDDSNIDFLEDFLDFLRIKGWIKHDRLKFIFRTITQYIFDDESKELHSKDIISTENKIKLIKLLRKHRMETVDIDGSILLPIIKKFFWGKLFGKENASEDKIPKTIDIVCSANQGYPGLVEYNGIVRTCGFELAQSCGKIFPEIQLDNEEIKRWNSVNFVLKKFLHKMCINCKFFFILIKDSALTINLKDMIII